MYEELLKYTREIRVLMHERSKKDLGRTNIEIIEMQLKFKEAVLKLISAVNTIDSNNIKEHGDPMECPTCSSPGHYDCADTKEAVFKDSIWYNKIVGAWECCDCWLK